VYKWVFSERSKSSGDESRRIASGSWQSVPITRTSHGKGAVAECRVSVVCLSFLTRVYCDETTTNRITRFSLVKFGNKIRRGSTRSGAQLMLEWLRTLPNRSHRTIHTYIMTSHHFRTATTNHRCSCMHDKHAVQPSTVMYSSLYSNRLDRTIATLRFLAKHVNHRC